MRILQQHLDFIEYEPISKEISSAEDILDTGKKRYEEIVALFVSVERGDDDEVARKAVEGTRSFLGKLKVARIIIYPYAHLSQNLAPPREALGVLKAMETYSTEAGLETYRAPFGWNKAFQIKVKGHPLAEQSRVYSSSSSSSSPEQAAPNTTASRPGTGVKQEVQHERVQQEMTEEQLLAKVKKSEFSGLPDTDHRVLGERLDLFSFQEPSPGMVFWHDKGLRLRNLLIALTRSELAERGYIEISTPSLSNIALWKVSGHWEHYRDNLFMTQLGDEEASLKPMNCPPTMLYYRTRRWSFRDLPLRVAIFDSLFRNELSGVASGLFRVKMFSQDDAHIFATDEQVGAEVAGAIDMMAKIYRIFGLEFSVNISTMPDEHIGTKEQWDRATQALMDVVSAKGLQYQVKEKEGAFYGPKIDVDVKDSMGRSWQCGTVQLDYMMPARFRLSYTGSDGSDHTPVVIHRAIYGSLERFIGIIIEHYQGRFPLWLSPVQVKVLTVSDETVEYANEVTRKLKENGVRAEQDSDTGTIGGKIRNAQLQKVPYMLVLGGKESSAGTVAVRTREGDVRYGVKLDELLAELKAKVQTYS
jgi:threonyl-tRNA synthetase